MQRINSTNRAANKFGAGKDGFQGGSPATGVKATYVTPEWANAVQEEIARAIEGAGIALDASKHDQLLAAIKSIAWGAGKTEAPWATEQTVAQKIVTDRPYEATVANIKMSGTQAVGTSNAVARGDHVHPTDTSRAPLESPSFTGTPAAPTPATGTRSTQLATTAFVGAESQIAAPTGSVYTFAGATVPTGWLKCNGALLSRTTYAALFAVIGTTYGAGDGSTTFALPDLRGEFVRGFDDARGVDSGRIFGSAQAAYAGSLTINTMPSNMQGLSAGTPVMDWITINGKIFNDNTNTVVVPVTPGDCRPRNVAMRYIIKY